MRRAARQIAQPVDGHVDLLAGIVVPFALGGLIAWHVAGDTTLFPDKTTRMQAALFTVMVLMAVATTLMATPIFQRV